MKNKIAVFDLDGTLWKVNSHYEILNLYYKTTFWTSLIYKVIYKILPKFGVYIRNKYFKRIPETFIENVKFDFDEEIVSILKNKRDSGYDIIIISNAPSEIIVKNAASRLNCRYLCAGIGDKYNVLSRNYSYEDLFVCTDNITDIDLLEKSTDYHIIATPKTYAFFKKRGFIVE